MVTIYLFTDAIKGRMKSPLKIILIDNCCQFAKLLKGVFGSQLEVKLDLFHAVRRFTTTILKKNPSRQNMIKEFKLIFRQTTDYGQKRSQTTPSASTAEQNLDAFISRWKNVEVKGVKALPKASQNALENIRLHIKRGCLSDIPVGAGTNKNERLHKNLNAHGIMGSTTNSINPAVANAALSRSFHLFNMKKESIKHIEPTSSLTLPPCQNNGECRGLCKGIFTFIVVLVQSFSSDP